MRAIKKDKNPTVKKVSHFRRTHCVGRDLCVDTRVYDVTHYNIIRVTCYTRIKSFCSKLLKHRRRSRLTLVMVHLPLLHFPTTSPLPAVLFPRHAYYCLLTFSSSSLATLFNVFARASVEHL